MRWKPLLSICVLAFAVGQAKADTIDFSQFGSPGTVLTNPVNGTTTGGVGVTLTSPNGSFTRFTEASHALGSFTWEGTFPSGAPLLFDGNGSGTVTLAFATAIQSLTLAAQANAFGNFVETMQAFNAANTLIATATSPTLFNCANLSCEGTQAFLTLAALDITRVTISVTNDSVGLALYGGAGANPVPLPGALPLFATGLSALGLLGWRRKRKAQAAA